jgi:two-component system nitrogen regulation sensor histidine kinase NtrY
MRVTDNDFQCEVLEKLEAPLTHLLRNAVEACSQSSTSPKVSIASEVDEERGVSNITVDDNGPGIEPSARERIFQPFFTSKRGGTGLGLALVQKIIVFHNGRITAGSSTLGGASLHVTLPTS